MVSDHNMKIEEQRKGTPKRLWNGWLSEGAIARMKEICERRRIGRVGKFSEAMLVEELILKARMPAKAKDAPDPNPPEQLSAA